MLTVIYAYPRDVYYPGVLFRTAYIAVKDVELVIISRKRIRLGDIARYSRIPVEYLKNVLKKCKSYDSIISILRENKSIVIVSKYFKEGIENIDISSIDKLEKENLCLVVDEYGDYLNYDFANSKVVRYWTGYYDNPAYEAISLLYLLYIRDPTRRVHLDDQDISDIDYSELVYIMRSILESVRSIGNYYIINPRVIVFSLRHLYRNHRYFIDMLDTDIKLDHTNGNIIEKVHVRIYRYDDLSPVEDYYIEYDGTLLKLPILTREGNFRYLRFYVNPDKQEVCVTSKICIKSREEVSPEEMLSSIF